MHYTSYIRIHVSKLVGSAASSPCPVQRTIVVIRRAYKSPEGSPLFFINKPTCSTSQQKLGLQYIYIYIDIYLYILYIRIIILQ